MRLIIDSDMVQMPRNCHECYLCYGGWCTVMPSEQDEMCPDSDRPEWCPLSIDAPISNVIPVEWLREKMLHGEPDDSKTAWRTLKMWQREQGAKQ